MDTLRAVGLAIQRYNLITPGETVIVAVSGGPDSLCLLHVLNTLAPDQELRLHVAHLDHGLRGAESDADAAFVTRLCTHWDLPCTVERVDVLGLAQQPGLSIEEAARHARYAFLGHVASDLQARTIAVGHNADDQAETVLMHWLRGSGLSGLRGMTPVTWLADYRLGRARSKGGGHADLKPNPLSEKAVRAGSDTDRQPAVAGPYAVRIVRPLLFSGRSEILRYCTAHGLTPRFDRSNEDTTYFRNRLRLELLPLLEDYNPQIRRILRQSATIFADEHELFRSCLSDAWQQVIVADAEGYQVFDLQAWRDLHRSLQRGVLRQAIASLRYSLRNISFQHVENALWALLELPPGSRVTLPAGLELVLGYNRFAVGDEGVQLPAGDLPLLAREWLSLMVPGLTPLPETAWQASTTLIDPADLPPGWERNQDPWLAWLDAQVIGPQPALRIRRDGDRFQPLGMGGSSKSLAELFTNEKTPVAARHRWPLLITTDGAVAWVCGLRVDERAKVTTDTAQVLQVRLEHRVAP